MLEKLAAAFQTFPYFPGITLPGDAALLEQVTHHRLTSDDVIFREDDAPDALYLVYRGQVEIVRLRGLLGDTLALLHPGDMFGEMGLLAGNPRNATARASEDTTLFRLTRETALLFAKRFPAFDARLAATFMDRQDKNRHYHEERAAAGKKLSLYAFEQREGDFDL